MGTAFGRRQKLAILMGCVGIDYPKDNMKMSNRTTIDTVQLAYLFWK